MGEEIFTGSCSGSTSCGGPAAYTKKYVAGEELGIILSPKASIEGAKFRAYIGGESESLFRDGKLEIIPSPKASIKGESSE